MRVKRLEIQGFKSFKDKTVIHFDHGITGIVGPNGCGKSNIVDAFFWVMGEQSYKHMRGNGSDDLIFNGSSKYSPLGIAEATLVLETDYTEPTETPDLKDQPAGATVRDVPVHLRAREVSVTRRLYRGGEGEYLINGISARLRDIHELFMDTGVGAKGYSVIEQGQIGKIVNSKPDDRRLLIEEAAGIAKYKARKKESLRKMEATETNLSRLNDIINEIERSANSLERQAQKTRQYKKLKDELVERETTWGRRKAQVLKQKLEKLKIERDTLEQNLAGLRAELQVCENDNEIKRTEQLNLTKDAEVWQEKVQRLSDELTREQSSLELSRQRQTDLNHQLTSLTDEQGELGEQILNAREKLVRRQAESEALAGQFAEATRLARELDAQVRDLRKTSDAERSSLDSLRSTILKGVTNASQLSSKLAGLQARLESGFAQKSQVEEEERSQSDLHQETELQNESLRSKVGGLKTQKETLEINLSEEQAKFSQLKAQAITLRDTRQKKSEELAQTRSRIQSFTELVTAYEGFEEGPRAALEWSREAAKSQGVSELHAVADCFDVQPGYEGVLENWLEDKIESLVSPNPVSAFSALKALRDQKQGRACVHLGGGAGHSHPQAITFDALKTTLQGLGLEVLGHLTDFVKVGNQPDLQREVAEDLIDSVCVVRSLEQNTKFLEHNLLSLGGWSIVDLSGVVLDSIEGTLRGGQEARDEARSLLRQRNSIQVFEAESRELSSQLAEIEARVAHNSEESERTEERVRDLQKELQTTAIELATQSRSLEQGTQRANELSKKRAQLAQQIARLEEDLNTSREARTQVEQELHAMTTDRADLEGKLAQTEERVREVDTLVHSQEALLQERRVEEASFRERTGGLQRELESQAGFIQERERRLHEIQRSLERLQSERTNFQGSETTIETKISELTLELGSSREHLSMLKDNLERISSEIQTSYDRTKVLSKAIEESNERTTHLAIENEKWNGELGHLTLNLEEKYGVGCLDLPLATPIQEEMSEPVITAEMSEEEERQLGEEVEHIRERIRKLGEVNPAAVEEYEEIKKRQDYLLTERSDLEHSIQNLKEAIEHINKTSEERFRKAFEAISDRFKRLFPIVFGGGSAELSLIYPEGSTDILEAGVDIMAQPPGKKVANITLLSGGEKALTAVSLIFAIFMVKPSPFCVLDEVDAPLDDANIGKFNALLREMAIKSQFIVITHNKKTMELNDTLYGVTMEEPGVSKMVSIEMH